LTARTRKKYVVEDCSPKIIISVTIGCLIVVNVTPSVDCWTWYESASATGLQARSMRWNVIAVAVRFFGAGGGKASVVALAPFDQSDAPAALTARTR
jgi:hypothetical protein